MAYSENYIMSIILQNSVIFYLLKHIFYLPESHQTFTMFLFKTNNLVTYAYKTTYKISFSCQYKKNVVITGTKKQLLFFL
jgi:hypothetical protein